MPARTPTRLKVMRGTLHSERVNPAEPHPPARHVSRPAWLSTAARPWWKRLRPILAQMHVLTAADPTALALLCDALAEYIAARDVLLEEGLTYETTSDRGGVMIRQRPEVGIAQDAWRRAKLMLTEFGLTPASRGKVSATDVGPANPLEEWERQAR